MTPTFGMRIAEPGTIERRDREEGGGRGVAGKDELLRAQFGLAAKRDIRSPSLADVGAEQSEHPLAMVARRDRLRSPG